MGGASREGRPGRSGALQVVGACIGEVDLDKLFRLRYDNRTYHSEGRDCMTRSQRFGIILLLDALLLIGLFSVADTPVIYFVAFFIAAIGNLMAGANDQP